MVKGQKAFVISAVLLVVVGGADYLYLHYKRHAEVESAAKQEAALSHGSIHSDYKSDPDDLVFLKNEHPMSLKDEKDLKGRTLWMSAGGQMDYYPYNGHTVDFSHSAGVLLGAEKIQVKDAVLQAAPKSAAFRIPQGQGQVLLVFTKPDDTADSTREYAVAVGNKDGGDFNLLTDQIFFYDDPHKLFAYWGPQVWKAIDEHRAILGMSERQVQMALGQVSVPHGDAIGDRTVEFDDQGKPKMITFEGGKATQIKDQSK